MIRFIFPPRPFSLSCRSYELSDLQARDATDQIADNESTGQCSDRIRTNRSARRFFELAVQLHSLLRKGRRRVCQGFCCRSRTINGTVCGAAQLVELRGRRVGHRVRHAMRCSGRRINLRVNCMRCGATGNGS